MTGDSEIIFHEPLTKMGNEKIIREQRERKNETNAGFKLATTD
jgi:hypothetical protein